MTTENWTRENLAWLAGLLEGEGSFLLTEKKSTNGGTYPEFSIRVNMTDGDIVARAALIAGCGSAAGPFEQPNPRHKPFWRWQVQRRDYVYALCAAVYPYMGQRRKERIEAIIAAYNASGAAKWEHGTRFGYDRYKCRCRACKDANNARHRALRVRRKARASRA